MADAATKERAHELIERMAPEKLEAVVPLLALIADPQRSPAAAPWPAAPAWEDEEISDEENEAVAKAKAETGPGTSMEELMAELCYAG